jgi:hypothetical protein
MRHFGYFLLITKLMKNIYLYIILHVNFFVLDYLRFKRRVHTCKIVNDISHFGFIPLKDHHFGSIPLLSHLHVGPHESMTCGVHGIYLKFGSFNGIDPIVP